jgi:hypothetical protein
MAIKELTASEALAQARDDIYQARGAVIRGDAHRQSQFARSAIDAAATTLMDPHATPREVVAAHSFLCEALALDGQTGWTESIDTAREASTLPPEDQKWLQLTLRGLISARSDKSFARLDDATYRSGGFGTC